jgi:hypothetical protein
MAGAFFLAFGLAAYRYFHTVVGATAGLALWIATHDSVKQLPGLKEHPGTASVLLLVLMVLVGVLFASKLRKLLIFISGLAVGLILSQTFAVFMSQGIISDTGFKFGNVDAMDILVGLVCGILCVIFERFFAVLITSVVGASLCSWAIGGSWTFPACLIIGLVAQPLVFGRFRSAPVPAGKDRTGSRTAVVFLLLLLTPSAASAAWVVERIISPTSGIVIDAGWRDAVKTGEKYALVDKNSLLVAENSSIFAIRSYAERQPGLTRGAVDAGREARQMI